MVDISMGIGPDGDREPNAKRRKTEQNKVGKVIMELSMVLFLSYNSYNTSIKAWRYPTILSQSGTNSNAEFIAAKPGVYIPYYPSSYLFIYLSYLPDIYYLIRSLLCLQGTLTPQQKQLFTQLQHQYNLQQQHQQIIRSQGADDAPHGAPVVAPQGPPPAYSTNTTVPYQQQHNSV